MVSTTSTPYVPTAPPPQPTTLPITSTTTTSTATHPTPTTTTTTENPPITPTTTTTTKINAESGPVGSNGDKTSTSLLIVALTNKTSITHPPTTLSTKRQQQPTKATRQPKSRLPLILGAIFGGSALVILVACVIVYILMKKGYIKAFSQSGGRGKGGEQSRMFPSTTTNGSSSPSER